MASRQWNRMTLARTILILSALALGGWALSDDYLIGGGPGFGIFQGAILAFGGCLLISAFLGQKVVAAGLGMLASASLVLILGELLLSWLFAPRFNSAYELNEIYLYGLRPNAVREYRHLPANGGESITYRVNSQGYRGEELADAGDFIRIAVYGDSFIHAEFSKLKDTFTEQLELRLRQRLRSDIEVVNAGVAGFGPDQILLRLQQELHLLDPDVLVVSIYTGNDFGDLIRNKLFRLDTTGNLIRNNPSLSDEIKFQAKLSENELLIRRVLRSIQAGFQRLPESTPEERVEQSLAQQINEFEEYVQDRNDVVVELRSDPYSADMSTDPDRPSSRYRVALMDKVITEIDALARSQGIPAIFMIIPHPIDVLDGSHESGIVDRNKYPGYSSEALSSAMINICKRQSLNCVELLTHMREKGGDSLFLRGGDDHWNDKGQRIAAELMAEVLGALLCQTGDSGVGPNPNCRDAPEVVADRGFAQ